ncbi:MAG: sugar phosphate nucleotidyltransferase [Syntrophomonadaceae bacterium]|nr:sugar phosphate nucleotidyltransferase [Syntrophomonadaceae bacterium]
MIAVVLAGGKGLRLWPESREKHPKQLCSFVGAKSMLDHTLDRLIASGYKHIIIITSDALLNKIADRITQRPDARQIEVLSEPEGRNTAPAVGLVLSKYYADSDQVLGIFPADHHVLDIPAFVETIQRATRAAENNHLATIGISPCRPETGYGYIEKTRWEVGTIPGVFEVNSFCEKPDLATANSYISTGQHMWNAGIYIGKAGILIEEFQNHLPHIYEKILLGFDSYISSYPELPSISLDYGIAEKSKRMAVVPGNFGWCDLGSWNALTEIHEQDDNSNICNGEDIMVLDSHNCIIKQVQKSVVLFGIDNLLLVETDDIIFIADRNKAQELKNLTDFLNEQKRYDLL